MMQPQVPNTIQPNMMQPPVPNMIQQPVPSNMTQQTVPNNATQPQVPNGMMENERQMTVPQQPRTIKERKMPPHREIPEKRTRPVKKKSIDQYEMELIQSTPIEELSGDDEDEEFEDGNDNDEDNFSNFKRDELFPRKQVGIRNGAGSYDYDSNFGGDHTETRVTRGIKSTATSMENTGKRGKNDIMSAALAMQKLREKEGEVIPKPTFG